VRLDRARGEREGGRMIENRRVRFANVEKLGKVELDLACDIWLKDIVAAAWATREVMKLAAHFMNYMRAANPSNLNLREMETVLQLNREEINRALSLMKLFAVLSTFTVDKDDVRANLVLSPLQILKMLEMKMRFMALASGAAAPRGDEAEAA
jgi:hypothetical protein